MIIRLAAVEYLLMFEWLKLFETKKESSINDNADLQIGILRATSSFKCELSNWKIWVSKIVKKHSKRELVGLI
mgnify:CR=1 FL=1|jgi:hypothetical protein